MMPTRRQSKYRAVRTTVNGWTFASKAEARRYSELLLLGAAGEIRNLEMQPRFPLKSNGEVIGFYIGDFRFEERFESEFAPGTYWRDVVEDVKSPASAGLAVYRLKRKLVESQHGIVIREVRYGR